MLMRGAQPGDGEVGARPVVAETLLGCSLGLSPVVPSTDRSGRAVIWRRSRTAPWSDRRGGVLGPGGSRIPAGGAAIGGIEPLKLRSKEGLALISGTDGILGMLVLAICDLERTLPHRRHRRRGLGRGPARTDRTFAADLVGLGHQPGQMESAENMMKLWRARRSSRATGKATPGSGTPTRCAAPPGPRCRP